MGHVVVEGEQAAVVKVSVRPSALTDDALRCIINATLSRSFGLQFGQPTTSPSTVRCRASGRSGVSQHHEKHACRIPEPRRRERQRREPDDRAGRRSTGAPAMVTSSVPASARIRASNGDECSVRPWPASNANRVTEPPAALARSGLRCLQGWPDERLEAARLSGG